jgi:tetratricopeptide (TPR) repeat protein
MRAPMLAALLALAPACFSQAGDTPRLRSIWHTARLRMEKQNDRWFEEGDFPRAIQSLRLMAQIFPHDYEIATNLGWMLENVEEYDEALSAYVRYLRDNPNDPDASFPQASFYYRRKLYAKVPPLLEPSLKLGKKPHANSYRLLAHSYEKLELLKDARRVWEMMIRAYPQDRAAKANLDRVIKKAGGSG